MSSAAEHDGLFVVTYRHSDELLPDANSALVERLKRAAAERGSRIGVIFDVGPAIGGVELSVPGFWLTVTGATNCPIRCMAIVTNSGGVRVAAKGFALANQMRRVDIAVAAFTDLPSAEAWARSQLT